MSDSTNYSMQIVTTMAIEEISDMTGIDKTKILEDFFSSETAKLLYDEETKVWAEGPSVVADMYIEEKGLKTIEKS